MLDDGTNTNLAIATDGRRRTAGEREVVVMMNKRGRRFMEES